MEMLQQLKERYGRYAEEAEAIKAAAPPTARMFGMGNDPRKDFRHRGFYEDVARWVNEFVASGPNEASAYEAAHWILAAASEHRGQECYGFMYAAQGLCKKLIPLLSREDCGKLVKFYDKHYPKRDRLPVQTEIYKQLWMKSY